MLNDLDRETGADVLLNENGNYGPKTADRIRRFQLDNNISPAKGHLGNKTWTVLLQQWLPVGEKD
jgi:peptidoglycan hydrolase-like protein with peptidoglycan-binding domain